jgi:CRISPR-associated protein Cmr4
MYLKSRLLYLYVESPLHAGAGTGLGAVDLPIQRERATGYPIVQASGLKGALRELAPDDGAKKWAVFGPDPDHADEHAGAFAPSDARILLFPVRSLKGVFAWTTAFDALQRWLREAEAAGIPGLPALPSESPGHAQDGEAQCYAAGEDVVTADGYVVLEEFAFRHVSDPENRVGLLASWLAKNALPYDRASYWAAQLAKKLVVLPDDEFRDFLLHGTEVLTRVRLENDSKTVAQGALWTEEHLPTDSLLYAPVRATRLRMPRSQQSADWAALEPPAQADAVLNWVQEQVNGRIQLGGDETVGRGIVHLRWSGEEVAHGR